MTRPAHYQSKYNRDFESETQELNRQAEKARLEEIWLAKMAEIEAILSPEEYDAFYDSLPDHAPTQAYIDICDTKLATLELEPVYQDTPAYY